MFEQDQDAQPAESSAAEEQVDQQQVQPEASAEQAEAPAPEPEKELPFHEHPRFREVIEQKNQFAQQLRQQELQMARLQAQLEERMRSQTPQAPSREEQLFRKLESIDPDLAQVLKDTHSKTSHVDKLERELEEFRSWKAEQEQTARRREAETTLSQLHTQFSVPKDIQDIYTAQIRMAADANPNLSVKDLPGLYKSIHEKFNAYMESVKRQERASYVQVKKADSKGPAPMAKGQAPGTPKMKYSENADEAKAELIKNILNKSRASKDI